MEDVLIPTTDYQENKRFLSRSYTSEKEFVSEYKKCYYGKPKAKELYLLALIELEKTISKGNINGFKNCSSLIGYINSAENQETLKTYYDNTENPLKSTNLVIVSCKYHKAEILNYLLDNNCKIFNDLSFKVGKLTILPNDEDETCHNAFYYAIRSRNVKLLDTLINKWPQDYFSNHLEELEFVLANAYDELKLKNVPLSDETIIFVENKLTDLRFFSSTSVPTESDVHLDNIKERITLVLENIILLGSNTNIVNDRFIFIAKFIARNLHILKRQLKSTYGRLPWEEMEFCLVAFVSSHMKHQEMNLFYHVFLNKGKILNHLENFANKLKEERENIGDNNSKLAELPKISRDKVVADIIKISPLFAALYDDYQQIRDIHSLNKIDTYLALALAVDSKEREGQLAITRALQVIGECLKNTLESPKLSKSTSELLVLSLPKNTRKIIMEIRDSISHALSLSKRTEIEENSDVNFFNGIQNDVKEIRIIITDILYDYKIKVITIILKNIIDSDNLEEIKEVAKVLTYAELDKMKLIGSYPKRQLEKMEKLIEELNNIVIEKTSSEIEIFNRMHTIINSEKSDLLNSRTDYVIGFLSMKNLSMLLDNPTFDWNDVKPLKYGYNKLLKNIAPEVEIGSVKEIGKLFLQVLLSFRARMPCSDSEKQGSLILNFFYALQGAVDITWLNKIRGLFNKAKQKKTKNILVELDKKHGHQLSLKLSELKRILTQNSLNNLIEEFPSYKKNKKLQTAIEMLVLDVMSILGSSYRCLANDHYFLDDRAPLLIGKNLRNHIAHDSAIIEVLMPEPLLSVILNANILTLHTTENINEKIIGKSVGDDPFKLNENYDRDLDVLKNQERMFAACEEGNLEDLKSSIINGADLNSRNLNQWTALHFASRGSSLEVTKFILDQNLSVNVKDINKQSPLHIAVANGRGRLVKILVEEVGLNIDDADINGKTPLHLAAGSGYEDIVKVLLKNKANTKIEDRLGYFPVHYAVHGNYKKVVEVLLEKEINLDIFETNGGFTLLHMTADKGNLELTNFLLERGADVNSKLDNDRTPLHSAAFNGHLEVVNALIIKGAAVNSRVMGGCTPLHYAVENGHEKVADSLLKHGANANIADKTYKNTPMHYAAKDGLEGILQLLLQHNGNSKVSTAEGLTPLHLAAKNGHKKIVIDLLNHGVDINATTTTNCSSLHVAVSMGYKEIVDILIQNKADANAKADNDFTPLCLASEKGHKEIVEILIKNKAIVDARDINGSAPLHAAALCGSRDVVDILIKNEAKVNGKDNDGFTPLHTAAQTGSTNVIDLLIKYQADVNARTNEDLTPLHVGVKNGHKDGVSVLIKNGANVDARDMAGDSPLHIAAQRCNKEVAEILIANGANVDAKNRNQRTPLFTAILHDNKLIVEVLIANGANINAKASSCEIIPLFSNIDSEDIEITPLFLAIARDNREIAEFLMKKGAHVNLQYTENVTLLHIAAYRGFRAIVNMLITKRVEIDAITIRNETPLHIAADKGFEDVVEILIAKGANVDSETSEGSTPLHLAASKGFSDVVEVLLSNGANVNVEDKKKRKPIDLAIVHGHLQVVKMIFQHKEADINAKGNDDWTALHIAAQGGFLEVAKLLVGLGADINARNSLGSKPIHIAARLGNKEMVEYFIKMGLSINDLGSANMTLLHCAAGGGKMDVAKYLIEHGVDVNAKDGKEAIPIHYAALFGQKDVIEFLLSNGSVYDAADYINRKPMDMATNEDVIKLLLLTEKLMDAVKLKRPSEVVKYIIKEGAFINSKNVNGEIPLHYAAWKGYDEIVEVLLQNKSNPNTVGKERFTPLHYAAKYSHLQIVKALLSNGAIFNALSDSGKTPLDFTVDKSICSLLKLVHDSFKNIKNSNSKVINDLNKIKDIGTIKAVMNARNRENKSLIVVAINNNYPKVEKLKEILQDDASSKVNEGLTLLGLLECYQPALVIFKSVFEKRKEILGPDNPGTLDIQLHIARTLYKQGTYQEALSIHEEVSQKQKEIFGSNHALTLSTRSAIALILHRLGRNEEAYTIFNEVFPMQNQILGSNHSDVLETQFHMALVLNTLGKYEEALNINREVFEKRTESLGADHPATLSIQNNIAMVLSGQGKLEEALDVYKDVFERRKRILGISHSDTLRTLHNMAGISFLQNNSQKALKNLMEVYNIQRNILGVSHPDTVDTQYNIANTLFLQGKFIGALKAYKECLEQRKAIYSPNNPSVIVTLKKMEAIYLKFKLDGFEFNFLQDLQHDINSAIAKGDIKTVQYLIKNGADANDIDMDGRAPLHYAADNGHIRVVEFLLKEGADATQVTSKGNTPLHTAASKGYKDIVEVLLQHVSRNRLNEFVNAQTNVGGTTSLHVAAKNGFLEVAKSLLQYGATYNMKNKNGETPFDLSKDKNVSDLLNLTEVLFERAKNGNIKFIKMLKSLKQDEFQAVTNARDNQGKTLLQILTVNNNKSIARVLLEMLK